MYSLEKAQEIISNSIKPLPSECVDLSDGLHRTVFSDVRAIIPQPSFDESTRDGYVIPPSCEHGKGAGRYNIVGEIPAGKAYGNELLPGTACRIMTGGCVPEGGGIVVPYENCVENNGEVVVENYFLQSADPCIQKTGSEIAQGDILVQSGVKLQPMHLALLASSGVKSVVVSSRPVVGFLCTGSELTNLSCGLERGQKISSNTFLLAGLSTLSGACPEDLGTVGDSKYDLLDSFVKAEARGLDLLISTGGMGPGKYDLVRDTFVEAGGQEIFTALNMRPGKSVLFGILGKTMFFGLPGPPPAVQTLFNVLVGPTLLAMQGGGERWPQKVQAYLQHQVKVKPSDVLRLKDGVLTSEGGLCTVRLAGRFESSNCYILLQPGVTYHPEGELVDVLIIIFGI